MAFDLESDLGNVEGGSRRTYQHLYAYSIKVRYIFNMNAITDVQVRLETYTCMWQGRSRAFSIRCSKHFKTEPHLIAYEASAHCLEDMTKRCKVVYTCDKFIESTQRLD